MPPTVPKSSLLTPELIAQLERMELVSRKVFRGRMKGERRSKRKGQSVEFADFRNYVPGDDLRFIDWNLYARLDQLFLLPLLLPVLVVGGSAGRDAMERRSMPATSTTPTPMTTSS